jgi:hypothetical protein
MRRTMVSAAVAAGLIGAAPAAAQEPPTYGGGKMPASAPRGSFVPTVGIVLQPRGTTIAFRFDTSIKCRESFYEVVARKTVPFDGRSYSASGKGRFSVSTRRGNFVRYRWRLRGQADGTIASGRLTITGTRRLDGRRVACRVKPTRRFSARVAGPAPAGSPAPPPKASFGGLSDVQTGGGLRGPVLLKVGSTGKRIRSRWTSFAECGRGPRADLTNFTPPMRLRADGSFSRAERFSVAYADVFVRFRVRFAGRVSGEFANGRLRMRASIYAPNRRRLLTRCDSGTRNWTAAMLRPIAPAG